MNNQKLIMENWRKYCDKQVMNRVYLLKEGKVHKETSLDLLIERRDRGEINLEEMIDILNESVVYETEQFIKEVEEEEAAPDQEKKKTFGYRMREKAYTFVYSKVGAYLTSLKDSTKAPQQKAAAHLEQIKAAMKKGDKAAVAALVSEKAFKAIIAGFKMVIRTIGKVVSALWTVVKVVGKFFKHWAVRILVIAALGLMLANVGSVAAAAVVTYKIANQVSGLVTGKTLTGHAVSKAVDAVVNEGVMDMADILGDIGVKEVSAAIIQLAQKLEDTPVWSEEEMSAMNFTNSDGSAIHDVSYNQEFADQALGNQLRALQSLKLVLKGMEGEDGMEAALGGNVSEEVGGAIKAALSVAKAHCENDLAACAGANKLADSITVSWSGQVEAETFMKSMESDDEWSDLYSSWSKQTGAYTVSGGEEAADELEESPQPSTIFKIKRT